MTRVERPLPLVSVVVHTFNHEHHVQAALESAYEQDHEAVELVVVDDRSRDRTASIVRDYVSQARVQSRFRRTVFIELDANAGAHAAINRGIHESRGDYINILNADERFARSRLAVLLRACADGPAEFAFSRVEPLADEGETSRVEIEHAYSVQDQIEFFPTVGYALLRHQCALSTGNFFFSRGLFDRVGDFSNLTYLHGWDFVLRCLLMTEPIFVREPLYFYRLRGHDPFLQQQTFAAPEAERVLRDYFFLCRNRPVANPLAPSPAWGPFFTAFVQASQQDRYLANPS